MNANTTRTLLGRVPPEAVRMVELPRLPGSLLDAYRKLTDLTGTVSDAMDKLGIVGAIPASVLHPSLPGERLVGQAVTVHNVERKDQVHRAAREGINKQGETEAYHLAEAGDIIVMDGIAGFSTMGGQSQTLARREGCAGAVIDGSFRDPDAGRAIGFPIWARGVTQITGKWRLETVEINGPLRIAGIQVQPGDLVVADDAGVCFVPHQQAQAVLDEAAAIDASDEKRKQDIANGVALRLLIPCKYS